MTNAFGTWFEERTRSHGFRDQPFVTEGDLVLRKAQVVPPKLLDSGSRCAWPESR